MRKMEIKEHYNFNLFMNIKTLKNTQNQWEIIS